MKTSSWFKYFGEGRIGISRGLPRRVPAGYRIYRKLAPGPWFNSVDAAEYERRFQAEILAPLDPRQVWGELHALVAPHEPVLLCFERDREDCHRLIVARWFEEALGVKIEEMP
jgi:hypothetical protein